MKDGLKAEITKKIGSIDGPELISTLEAMGVGDDVQFYDRGISIPAGLIEDVQDFQRQLSTLSDDRAFTVNVSKARIQINIYAVKQDESSGSVKTESQSKFSSHILCHGVRKTQYLAMNCSNYIL